MLVEFSVENYRAIWSRQTLSMVATRAFKQHEGTHTIEAETLEKGGRLLRAAAIFGPNASGKSTLLRALAFMRDQVINSAKRGQADEEINTVPFKLAADSLAQPTTFEIQFIQEDVRYQYGFSCTTERFTEEWLLAYPGNHPQKWFHRVVNPESGQDEYKFSSNFQGGRLRNDWRAQTRKNALFLSTALQLNNKQLRPILSWFQARLKIINKNQPINHLHTMQKCRDAIQKKNILRFLNAADLTINDVDVEANVFSSDMLPKSLAGPLREAIAQEMAGQEFHRPTFFHKAVDSDRLVQFDESEESEGTRALFALAGPWIEAMQSSQVLFVDEIDSSMHPIVVHLLVESLLKGALQSQLVLTTHDTTVLSTKLLRRDQIWFMERSAKQEATLYPLSDFGPRDAEAIERGYLLGRYGGIPIVGSINIDGNG